MNKPIVVDCGELGWSLYLVAHLRYLKDYYGFTMAVMTYPDRQCLYKGVANEIFKIPDEFYEKFDTAEQECFGNKASSDPESATRLKAFFIKVIPHGYYIPRGFEFTCKQFGYLYKHAPFKYRKLLASLGIDKEILVFPRFRKGRFWKRNLPEMFYIELTDKLCKEFPHRIVRTIGKKSGAYYFGCIETNYRNSIKEKSDLQDLIDNCQVAFATVGSQSAPPKIALLQGTPTFMIGHEKERHTKTENWMKTKCGFYEVSDYQNFNFDECINQVIEFIRSLE